MSTKPWPEQWRSLLEPKFASRRRLAEAAHVSTQTIVRLVDNIGEPDPATVRAVAAALGVTPDRVLKTAGLSRRDRGPFILPDRASELTDVQRSAILAVLRAMLAPEGEEIPNGTPMNDGEDEPGSALEVSTEEAAQAVMGQEAPKKSGSRTPKRRQDRPA